MAEIPALLLASFAPDTRKQAEQSLNSLSIQPGFLTVLLQLVLNTSQEKAVRLAGSVLLKNTVRRRWEDDEPLVADAEKAQLRSQLVQAMIALSGSNDKPIRAQVAETISIVAKYDFPERWDDLVDQLVASLSPDPSSYSTNVSVLETAHSIFGPWRSEMRSNELYTVINFVLSRFIEPFLNIFRHTATLLLSNPLPAKEQTQTIAQAQSVLMTIFYDFTCQDLPPAIEDAHAEFFGPEQGWFVKFLAWDPDLLKEDPDDPTPSLPSIIQTHIFEIAELYTHRYPELLTSSSSVETYVRALWNLLGGGHRSGISYDGLVSQSLRFLSTAIRSGNYRQIFEAKETISGLVDGVVVPNIGLREHEVEQFEDDPLEYVRIDLSFASSASGGGVGGLNAEGTTRRQAAADVLRALVSSGFEAHTTEVVGSFINRGLQSYNANRSAENAWQSKDSAVYLLTAVATRGATAQQGVTATNALVDVVQFFSEHVFEDLRAEADSVHPILQVDAIRFLYSFRNQLTKEQLIAVLPYLQLHLRSTYYVCHTYAAITIERILFIKKGTALLFNEEDVRGIAPEILNAVLTNIEVRRTPEKIAENEYLMKCAMRVILTARQTLAPSYERLLQRLVAILDAISKNPSNPNFDQYLFESISALIRLMAPTGPQVLSVFEKSLFGPFTVILQQDIDQYSPYVFQILSQMLELHQGNVPPEYQTLLPFLLQPASWQQKGSIPGLVRLLKAFLRTTGPALAASGQYTAVLAVVQQKLIPSKVNDAWGFELLQAIMQYIPPATLQPLMKSVITMLLTRLQTARTDKYAYSLIYFFMYTFAIQRDGVTPDFLISGVESVQPQLWSQILSNVVLPQISKMLPKDRKVVIVGLTKMLTQSAITLSEPAVRHWPAAFTELVKLFSETKHLQSAQLTQAEDPDEVLRSLDFEEQGAGYQAAYSKLAASETTTEDPVAFVTDPRDFVGQELQKAAKSNSNIGSYMRMADLAVVRPFVDSLTKAGYVL